MHDPTIEALLAKAVQGDLLPEESEQLRVACQDDPKLVQHLANLLSVDRQLSLALEEEPNQFAREWSHRMAHEQEEAQGDEFVKQVIQRLERPQRKVRVLATMAAAAVIVVAACLVMLLRPSHGVAEMVRSEATDWQIPKAALKVGERITFEQGLIALRYYHGVQVVLEGPADFELTSKTSGFLHHGRLVAEIDDAKARGFVIDGVHGRLVDLGTKFGVSVEQDGEMEVHVLEGVVRATSNVDGSTTKLHQNEAMRLGLKDSQRLAQADGGAFITQLPPYAERTPLHIRWSFEETEGTLARNSGRGLADGTQADAVIKNEAQRITGHFGNAVRFDGKATYMEADYRGISGTGPRTVAFWVRLPKDFGDREGFGIVNWGTHEHEGSAWQVAINSNATEGPIGRLRIGANGGEVIGTTDLRDYQWHHCAVVMYGGSNGKPNTATHILLYVDGELETTVRKSILAIDTDVTLDHGIWMGRNLGFTTDGSNSGGDYGQFFRGDLDEVIICDTALNQVQLHRLMTDNVMP